MVYLYSLEKDCKEVCNMDDIVRDKVLEILHNSHSANICRYVNMKVYVHNMYKFIVFNSEIVSIYPIHLVEYTNYMNDGNYMHIQRLLDHFVSSFIILCHTHLTHMFILTLTYHRMTWIKLNGIKYQQQDYVIISWQDDDDLPIFGHIISIFVVQNTAFFKIQMFVTLGIDRHYHSFVIHEGDEKEVVVCLTELMDTSVYNSH